MLSLCKVTAFIGLYNMFKSREGELVEGYYTVDFIPCCTYRKFMVHRLQ